MLADNLVYVVCVYFLILNFISMYTCCFDLEKIVKINYAQGYSIGARSEQKKDF